MESDWVLHAPGINERRFRTLDEALIEAASIIECYTRDGVTWDQKVVGVRIVHKGKITHWATEMPCRCPHCEKRCAENPEDGTLFFDEDYHCDYVMLPMNQKNSLTCP